MAQGVLNACAVRLSDDCRIEIPETVRNAVGLVPGGTVVLFADEGCTTVVPGRPLSEMRGFVKGIETDVPREGDRV